MNECVEPWTKTRLTTQLRVLLTDLVADLPLLNILRVFGRLLKAHVFD